MATTTKEVWDRYYAKHKEKICARTRLWTKLNRVKAIQAVKERHRRTKLRAIEYLGGKCKKCN